MTLLPKPFVFVRHGQTPLNRDRLIGGRTEVPLTATGEQQARDAAPLLANHPWSIVAVSPQQRARRTAELLLPGASLKLVPDLRERDWGDLECCPLSEQTPYEETPPNGEAWLPFCTRVTHALNTLLAQYDTPLIVAHSGVFRVIRLLATGTPHGERVGNVVPQWILPGATPDDWKIIPLEKMNAD
ncbi:histidine phosphatase family protein [Pseudescherichia vulneris]|uniref:histidine phosphatase family protein n=1 Tax=Pseudescherichia vulneris TaxID=566 RepID=UPI0012AB96D7|nr:histidine phosphatase family protein [Pseudescherichia vulneris]MDU5455090.1 histidine phosphatase family protein [Pseudescherichia vulneris]